MDPCSNVMRLMSNAFTLSWLVYRTKAKSDSSKNELFFRGDP